MSGGVPFSYGRVLALCDRATRLGPLPSEKLAVVLWRIDFEHYARYGTSITGATWVKGTWRRPVFIRELGEDWFRRYVRARNPWWANAAGWALAAYALARAAR